MRSMIATSVLAFLIASVAWPGDSRDCGLPEPFDTGTVYLKTLYVDPSGSDANGTGSREAPFETVGEAAQHTTPGTQIVLSKGKHVPGNFIHTLQGEPNAPICIRGESRDETIFSGGSVALQMSDPRYVVLEDFTVEGASGNGINIDDGGSYETPAEHVILRRLTVRNIGPSGNRDGIKLSGLDRFRVEDCLIEKPGDGGSGIDMVGCHDGIIAHNRFRAMSSNSIQAKGGSARILIYANHFEEGGLRAVNAGGSTGMQFFRPIDATAEARQITVWANIIENSQAPVAFVGCENCLFAHNTVYRPGKWAARILQENNHSRLIRSSDNVYANNIIVFDDRVNTFVNIGPNTHPETFVFAGNLWFDLADPRFSGPQLPVEEIGGLVQKAPRFIDAEQGDFHLGDESPAIGEAEPLAPIAETHSLYPAGVGDYEGLCWGKPASIGSHEGAPPSGVEDWEAKQP